MIEISDDQLHIGQPPPPMQRCALELACEALPEAQRVAAIDDLLGGIARGERSLDGLVAAWTDQQILAAVWSELHAGRAAGLWPPRASDLARKNLADDLLQSLLAQLESTPVTLVQCLLNTDVGDDAERLRRAGFEHSCDLLFLVSHAGHFPTAPVASHLTFLPFHPGNLDRMAAIVELTYRGSLDCPAIDRRRDPRDVVEGYRATSGNDLSHWLIVATADGDVGCLLLARDQRQPSWELVYMGLAPEARGRGWGIEVVRYAQWMVRKQGGERLVLAVDATNEPALRIYAAAGFTAWDRRSVFLKFFSSGGDRLPSH
jgi:mycothiol synthase